jgi:release factor glutamine methyltransferase
LCNGNNGMDCTNVRQVAETQASIAPVVARLRAAGCVFAEDEARILVDAAPDPATLEKLVLRRIAGEPLEYIVGATQFGGLMVMVLPGVFVPRQRSLLLVDVAVAGAPPRGVAVDLCCGSGALGALFAMRLPDAELYAADIDPVAVDCARLNLGHRGQVVCGDLFDPLPAALGGHIDVLMCNAPYVPTAAMRTMPPEARDFEPAGTLDGGPDGLDFLRRVAVRAPAWLAPTGRLIMEIGDRQIDLATRVFDNAGLAPSIHADPERGATVIVGANGEAVRTV